MGKALVTCQGHMPQPIVASAASNEWEQSFLDPY